MFPELVVYPELITCMICKEQVDRNTIHDHCAAIHPELYPEQLDEQLHDQLDEPEFGEDDFEVSEVVVEDQLDETEFGEDDLEVSEVVVEEQSEVESVDSYGLMGLFFDEEAELSHNGEDESEAESDNSYGLPAAVLPHIVAGPPNVVPVAPPDIIACIVCNAQVDRQLIYAHFAAHHPDLPAVAPLPPVVAPPPPEGIIACIVCNAAVEEHMMDDHFLAEHQVIHVHVVNADEFHFLAGPPYVEQAPAVEQPPPPPAAVPHIIAPVIISCLVCNAEVDHQMIQDHFIAEHPNLIWNPPPADLFEEEEELDEEHEDGFGLAGLFKEEEELDEEHEDGFGLADLFEEEEELDEEQEDGFGLADLFVEEEEEEEEELEEEAILNFYNF